MNFAGNFGPQKFRDLFVYELKGKSSKPRSAHKNGIARSEWNAHIQIYIYIYLMRSKRNG